MRDLSNIVNWVANMFVRAELARANIPAFSVIQKGTSADQWHIGVLAHTSGQVILFIRQPEQWVVDLLLPISEEHEKKFGEGVGPGWLPTDHVAKRYDIKTPEALARFVEVVQDAFGETDADWHWPMDGSRDNCVWNLLSLYKSLDVRDLTFVPAPHGVPDIARLEIGALQGIGNGAGVILPAVVRAAHQEEALTIAERDWGKTGEDTAHMRSLFSIAARHAAEEMQELLSKTRHPREVCLVTAKLEYWQTRRVEVLRARGHHKEANAVERKLQSVRVNLLAMWLNEKGYFDQHAASEMSVGIKTRTLLVGRIWLLLDRMKLEYAAEGIQQEFTQLCQKLPRADVVEAARLMRRCP